MTPLLSSLSALSNLPSGSSICPLIPFSLTPAASSRCCCFASLALSSAAQLSRYMLVLTSSLAFSSKSRALGPEDKLATRKRLLKRRQNRDLRELLGSLAGALVDSAEEEELLVEVEDEGAREDESEEGSGRALAATSSRQIMMRFCLVEERGV